MANTAAWTTSGLALTTLLCTGAAWAQNTADAHAGNDQRWRVQLTPYVWMPSVKTHLQISPQLPSVHARQSFGDVWDDLDAAVFIHGTARKDRLVLYGDLSYVALSAQGLVPPGLTAHAKLRQTSSTWAAGYQWLPSSQDSVDTMFGLRLWDIHTRVQAPPLGSGQISASWVDPIVAARWRHAVNARWSTLLYGDVGGFGAGSHSTWQWLGTVNYELTDHVYLSAGYRQLKVDYRTGGQRLNLRLQGPVLGATWRF